MKPAKYIFLIAGIYGIVVTLPLYFTEVKINIDYPPAIKHPEYYYGFAGVTLVWQVLFLFIASDPLRYRKIMIPCMLEKLSVLPMLCILYPQGRFPQLWLPWIVIDLVLGALFFIAYIKTKVE